ncbi:MAG: site-specific integrase [Anaerolineales bacterium]|nr:site-specific integrase [Anaerolineales bacterium]
MPVTIEQLPLFSQLPEDVRPAPAARAAGPALTATASLKAAIVAWKEHLIKENASLNTVKSFGGDLNLLAAFLGAGRSLNQIATRDLEKWLLAQKASGRSPKTYSRRVTSLKAFFRWLEQTSVLTHDPAAALIQQTVLSPLPQVLTDDEVEQALAAGRRLWHNADKPDIRPYLLFTLLLQTGIKKSECLALEINHIDLADPAAPLLWVRYQETRNRYKERKLKLEPGWVAVYQSYLAHYQPEQKLFPYKARRLEYLLEDISVAAGLDKHLSFEMCRWTGAVRDARAGLEFDRIRQKLGLSKIQWREISAKLKKLLEAPA